MSEASDVAQSALIVIDLQNDFLAQGGACPRRHVDPLHLAQAITWLARAAREQGRAVVWVTSVYGELEGGEELRGQTHVGAPCCARGSWGAELVAGLGPVLAEGAGPADEWRVEKRWHSAFRETDLDARLRARGVSKVVLCGVATNVCVLATARDAARLGYRVEILADASAAATPSKHLRGLGEVEALGGRVRRWGEVLDEGPGALQVKGVGSGGSALWCGALRGVLPGNAFEAIEREVAWGAMSHRGGEVPRLVAVQGARSPEGAEPLYRHPVDEQPALADFTPAVDAVRREVERRVGHPLNHCLLQLYRDGRDWISEHSDKTLDLVRPSHIVNVSFGRLRTMALKPKHEAGVAQRLPLPPGSFLVMDLATNRDFYHSIRQEGSEGGPRISLTFRHIGTFWHPASGAVWGVGAPSSGRAVAEARASARAALAPEDRGRDERAEAEKMLRLFREENLDPGFDAAAYRPGFEVVNFRSLREAP
ncbi:MAG: isochorismatase family protein [Polyangiaceae bacterium]|nr:isochorismatase family protein [Polyangiaceae bacterium]